MTTPQPIAQLQPVEPLIVPRKTVLKEVPSGEIRIEDGADGAYLMFDCECLDALPYCRAQCCALKGTVVTPDEYHSGEYKAFWDEQVDAMVLARDADGFCNYLSRETKLCTIYEKRPGCCQKFHCTRDANARGWKLANHVDRQSHW